MAEVVVRMVEQQVARPRSGPEGRRRRPVGSRAARRREDGRRPPAATPGWRRSPGAMSPRPPARSSSLIRRAAASSRIGAPATASTAAAGRRPLDLQPDDRVDGPLIELLLDRLEQIAGAASSSSRSPFRVTRKSAASSTAAARIQHAQVGHHDLLHRHHVVPVGQRDEPRQRRRQSHVREVERARSRHPAAPRPDTA